MKRLTESDFEELKKELYFLQTEGRKEMAYNIKSALELGDCSHPTFLKVKKEQARLEQIISDMEDDVKNAVVFKTIK